MMTSAGRQILASGAVLAGAGAWWNYPELLASGAALALTVVCAVGYVIRRPRITVVAGLDAHRIFVSERATLTVTAQGRWTLARPLLVRQVVGRITSEFRLVAGTAEALTSHRTLPRLERGVYAVQPAEAVVADPLRLAERTWPVGAASTLYVRPEILEVRAGGMGGPAELDASTQPSVTSGGDAFYSLREWGPDDDWRQVHWPTTARKGTLMVRHSAMPDEPLQVMVLDNSASAYTIQAFEDAVQVIAWMSVAALQAQHRLHLHTIDGRIRLILEPGPGDVGILLDALAGVTSSYAPGRLDPYQLLDSSGQVAAVTVVTGRSGESSTRWIEDVHGRFFSSTLVAIGRSGSPAMRFGGNVRTFVASDARAFRQQWNRADLS